MNDVGQGSVLSDLHMLTNRTTVRKYLPYIHQSAARSRLFVFNGDIFDFKWSREDGIDASIAWAANWVQDLVERFPDCQFIFMAGNHDSLDSYCERMEALARSHRNLFWEKYHIRIGDRLFLHGDVYHGGVAGERLDEYRANWNSPAQKHPVFHGVYWMSAKSGLQRLVLPFQFKRQCARSIKRYLDRVLPEETSQEIHHVYFGHVHRSFEDFNYADYCFHNTGAALHSIRLRVLHFPVNGEKVIFSDQSDLLLPPKSG